MSGIRGKNTRPEMLIRKGLHARVSGTVFMTGLFPADRTWFLEIVVR